MRRCRTIFVSNWFLVLVFICSIVYFCYTITKPISNSWDLQDISVEGTVVRVIERELTEIWIQKGGKHRLRIFFSSIEKVNVGDHIIAKGVFEVPSNNTIPNGFNYADYLWHHREKATFRARGIVTIGRSRNLLLTIKRGLISIIDKRENRDYLFLFLLGDNSKLSTIVTESFRSNGISHLFSISGMHFSLFIDGISFLLLRKRKESLFSLLVLSFFLFSYLILIDFIPSACRAFLLWEFMMISKLGKFEWSTIRCFLFMITAILFWKPWYLFDTGFQFSAVLSFFLCQLRGYSKTNSRFLKAVYFSIFAFIVSLPITLYYYFVINFLSIIWNVLLIPFVTLFLFPIQLLSFLFPFLSSFAFCLGKWFGEFSQFLTTFNFFTLSFHKPPWWWVLLYYICLWLFFRIRYKKILGIGISFLVFFLYHWNFFVSQSYFLMLDVGQGDSMLIHSNNQTMLVDTGGRYSKSDVGIYQQRLKPLLMSLGIHKIDILCLTHGDFDHLGEAVKLIEDFSIKKVYFNEGVFNSNEKEVERHLIKRGIPYSILKEKTFFRLGEFSFFSLGKNFSFENDSSIILLGKIKENYFLLTGDATVQTERYLIDKYQLPKLLFLKVGHHGSRTSSSIEFLEALKPQYSLISVGEENRYGHPNLEVLRRLKQVSEFIYMTSTNGSILIKFQKSVTFFIFPP